MYGDIMDELQDRWDRLLDKASFFFKLGHITMYYRHFSKLKAMKHCRDGLDI